MKQRGESVNGWVASHSSPVWIYRRSTCCRCSGFDATRDRAEDISALLADANSELIDGNGESKALSDGLLLIRYLFGFTGDALIVGAIGEGATRDTSDAVEAHERAGSKFE